MHLLHLAPLLFTLLLASLPHCKPQSDAYFRYSSCAPKPYQCGALQFDIGYPFSVNGVDRPDYCSVPGYLLSCTDAGKLVTTMNSSGGGLFHVTGVDYGNRLLTVVDEGLAEQTCPQPYRNATFDGAMFAYTDRDQFLTAYISCSASSSSSLPLALDFFSCLSGGRSYYSLDNGTVAPDVLGPCSSMLVLPCNPTMAGSLAAGNSYLWGCDKRRFRRAVEGGCGVVWRL
jgi:hypothetical protein